MGSLLPFLISVGVLAGVLAGFTWLAVRVRRRGLAGDAMRAALASYEEAFRSTAHTSHIEVRAQAARRVPLPSPGGRGATGDEGTDEAGHVRHPSVPARRGRRGARRWFGRWRRR